jgi:flagellar hook-length control protein FliK
MKVHVLVENKDTLSLLQRDSHTLRAALDQAGIQTDNASLSFDMAGGEQSFNQMLGGSQDGNSGNSGTKFSLKMEDIPSDVALQMMETKMDFIPDMSTGNIHYSLLV